ncbi:MAG: hypothetical protein QOF02_3893 [Blastocatellia bacterium]|jgi:hypothetical protein|nr:hypothetical protein [Blastocatellia bacterium]
MTMSENEGPGKIAQDEEKMEAEKSPTEKLEGEKLTGSLTPGVEKADNSEVKEERSPNTE